jgi:carboxylate-amine ligase
VSAEAEDYTLGVEEEYQIIDPETRGLSPSGEAVVRRAQQALGKEHVAPELRTSQVEAMTPICRTLAEVRAELLRLRRGVIGAAAGEGCQVAAASTHPFSHWREQPVTPRSATGRSWRGSSS